MSRRPAAWLLAAGASLIIALTTAALGRGTSTAPLTREALASRFDDDMRHVVLNWEPADPRPEAQRRAALFDFVYQTYQASAWIPQSLFDANVVTHAIAGDVPTIVGEKAGLALWRDNPRVVAFGMAPNVAGDRPTVRATDRTRAGGAERGHGVPPSDAVGGSAGAKPPGSLKWTVNCLVCHTAEIDGVVYFGAGTKTFDERWLGEALKRLTSTPLRALISRPGDRDAIAEANRILNSHHHDKIDSLTRARSTAFAASHVELYMRPHHGAMPAVDDVGRGDVKTPPLWHTAAKMPVGRWYTDGSFHGPFPLMASSMELEKDRPFDALTKEVIPTIKQEFVDVLQYIRPPRYPYPIDTALAARGKALFMSAEMGCSHCHGTYDGLGHVAWPGVHVDVGTDRSRLDVVSEGFLDAFRASPIAAEGALVKSEGYAAPPLTGVWADFPYLHNGSVPTLYDLLGPVSARPSVFQVTAARHLDRARVGQPRTIDPAIGSLSEEELRRRFGDDRDWFNALRPGCANTGHDVWSRIGSEANRRALIEYLKTL